MAYTITNTAGYALDLGDQQLAAGASVTVGVPTVRARQLSHAGLVSITGDPADTLPSPGSGSGVPAGGSTGQVLKKNSGTDGDAGWGAVPADATKADAAAVLAGVPTGTPVTTTATLTRNHLTPADATAGPFTATLPAPTAVGQVIAVEKTDATANVVTVSGTIRGVGASTLPLRLPNEMVLLVAESLSSWRPYGSHKTLTSLDARYPAAYGMAFGRATCSVPVGDYINVIGNFQSNGTETSGTYRVFVPIADPAATVVLPCWNNLSNFSQLGTFGAPNAITIAAALETSDGNLVPFTFNGQHTITISNAAQVAVPDTPLSFGALVTDAGAPGLKGVFVRTYVQVAASRVDTAGTTSGSATVTDTSILAADQGRRVTGTGIPNNTYVGTVTVGTSFLLSSSATTQVNVNATVTNATASLTIASYWPLNCSTLPNANTRNGAAGSNGADLTVDGTSGGALPGAQNASCYGPFTVLGRPMTTRKPIVGSLTDSIFAGTTDNSTGPVSRACAALGVPHVKISKASEAATTWATAAGRRYIADKLSGVTHLIIELGTNDGVDTLPKATTLQTNLTTLVTYFSGLGVKVYLTTVPPKGSSSTNGYATTGGQTLFNTAAGLAQINSWIRGVPANVSGVIDMNTLVSTATDSGLWAVSASGRQVTDAVTTSGSNVVTSATASFTVADVGLGISVTGGLTATNAVIAAAGLTSTSVNVVSRTNSGTAVNATASVSAATAGIGAWFGTADGTHPQTTYMQGAIATAVQNLVATFSL